jgi:hypothetical protein
MCCHPDEPGVARREVVPSVLRWACSQPFRAAGGGGAPMGRSRLSEGAVLAAKFDKGLHMLPAEDLYTLPQMSCTDFRSETTHCTGTHVAAMSVIHISLVCVNLNVIDRHVGQE